MSKLSRLRISGVRSFDPEEEQEIKFSTPVTLFLGQNGCGKTSIIESVKYAITGDLPSGTKSGQGFVHDPNMAQKSETRAQVKLKIYDIRGKPVTVQKIAKVSNISSGLRFQNMNNTITRDGEHISNRCIDIHTEMCRSMGVSKAILNNVIFCHQEDSYWPLEEPKKLKERFDTIFDSDKYNKCIDRIIKIKKQKVDKLKFVSSEVDFKKRTKIQMEKKKEQLQEKQERMREMDDEIKEKSEMLIPLQSKLEGVYKLEKEIRLLEAEAERLKTQITNNQDQQADILSSINEIDCSDEDLESRITSFQSDTEKTQTEMKQLEKNKDDIETKESNTRKQIEKLQINLVKLQEEDKQNKSRIKQQQNIINSLKTDFNVDSDRNDNIISIFEQKKKELDNAALNFEKDMDQREKDMQDTIDTCRTKYVQLKQEIDTKTQQISQLKVEKQKVTRRLNELNTYDDQLINVENRLSRTENDLKVLESQVNVSDLKDDIENEKNKYETLEEQLQKVEKEIQILQNYSSIQTELDLHNENLLKKQNDMKKLFYKHETDLEYIFKNDIPKINLKQNLDKYIKEQNKIVNETDFNISKEEKIVNKLEINLNVQKDKLKTMQRDYIQDKENIDDIYNGEAFEKVEENINKIIDDLQIQKGEFTNSIQMYTKFIQSFKNDNPCCPVCMRDVQEKSESNKIVTEIEKKIKDFPNLAKQAELQLSKQLARQTKILELKPVYFKIQKIESTEMPTLKKLIASYQQELEEKNENLEKLKNNVNKPKRNQDLATSIISDATLIDQYNIEIKKLTEEIQTLKSKMPSSQSSRNIQDAYFEQENLKSSTKESRQKLDSLTEKLTKHSDRLQNLRDQRNDLKTKELNIKQGLQDKNTLESKRKEVETKINELTNELKDTNNEIQPTKLQLDDAIKNKDERKKEDKKKYENLTNIARQFDNYLNEIIDLDKLINNCKENDIERHIERTLISLQRFNDELTTFSDKKNTITSQIDGLKDQILNKKSYFRELLDNKKLREKRVALISLLEKYRTLEKGIGDEDTIKILEHKQQLEIKISDYSIEISKLKGKKSELEETIIEAKNELAQPMFANAIKEYKAKFYEHTILQHNITDLEICVKAIDWSMVQYHKQQMVYINETIRELWRAIYKGNDIDYIEIKTEVEQTGKASDKRRVYQYRLVQVKNEIEIDMRGRCSAGQKVLASLVVRIALADTFSTKCGILALDEPTTNLDKENIASLCEALCDLINKKKNQDSFQLLIITHDQDFLQKLSRAVFMENYIHVSRNSFGKSVVTLKPIIF